MILFLIAIPIAAYVLRNRKDSRYKEPLHLKEWRKAIEEIEKENK